MKTVPTNMSKAVKSVLDKALISDDQIIAIDYFDEQVIVSMEYSRYNLMRIKEVGEWEMSIGIAGLMHFSKHFLGTELVITVG